MVSHEYRKHTCCKLLDKLASTNNKQRIIAKRSLLGNVHNFSAKRVMRTKRNGYASRALSVHELDDELSLDNIVDCNLIGYQLYIVMWCDLIG